MTKRRGDALRAFAAAALAGVAADAAAQGVEYQAHGSLAQGFILSQGNNYYGNSKDGSLAYYEAALNGTVRPLPSLLLSAQVVARDAGATDDGKPRVDYAFLDYAFLDHADSNAGLRLGRVKNAFGLFNDTRDIVFTRPGIVLPSNYFDSSGARALLFASDGAQAYGSANVGGHYLSAIASYAPDHRLSPPQEARFFGTLGQTGTTHLDDFYLARVQDEWGRFTAGLSYVHGLIDFEPDPGQALDFQLGFRLYQLSLRYNAPRFALTTEYGVNRTDTAYSFGGPPVQASNSGDNAYVQGDYFLTSEWTLRARWDSSFADRNHRSGDGGAMCASNGTTTDRHLCYAHDASVGASWDSGLHWGVWGEYHLIDGLATADARDNGPVLDPHWSMFLLMAAFRF